MKKNIISWIMTAFLLVAASSAFGDVFSVTADVPVLFVPSGENTVNSVTGLKAGASLVVVPVGIGAEQYTVSFAEDDSDADIETTYTLLDFFFNLPIPIVNIAVGVGAGVAQTADTDVPNVPGSSLKIDDAALTQFFVSLGYNIIPLLDVHLGAHFINADTAKAEVEVPGATSDSDVDLSGSMYSIGIKLGF